MVQSQPPKFLDDLIYLMIVNLVKTSVSDLDYAVTL